MNRYADLKEKRISTLTNQHSYKVSQFHKTLKANSGQNLSKLQVSLAIRWHLSTISLKEVILEDD